MEMDDAGRAAAALLEGGEPAKECLRNDAGLPSASETHTTVLNSSPKRAALARVAELKERRDFASLVHDMDAFPELEELQRAGCAAFSLMLGDDGSWEDAAAAGVVECVVRALDLFQHSAETQRISLMALNKLFLATRSQGIVSVAGKAGAVRLAVRALRSFPEDYRVVGTAFYVLGQLLGRFGASLQQFCDEAVSLNAPLLSLAALRRCTKDANVQGGACSCLSRLCKLDQIVGSPRGTTADAFSMGAMELALAVMRVHRSRVNACANASALVCRLCINETSAVKAKRLGAPALLQAAMKAHPSAQNVQQNAAAALCNIQHFIDAACARADAKMAELIAGEEAAKAGNGGAAAPKKAGKSKGKGGDAAATSTPRPSLPPPLRHGWRASPDESSDQAAQGQGGCCCTQGCCRVRLCCRRGGGGGGGGF